MSNHIPGSIRVKALLVAAIISIAVLSSAAMARGATITEFSTGIPPFSGVHGIAAGPDGNLWFTEESANRIGRITPQGVVTQFGGFFQHPGLPPAGLPPGSFPYEIVAGPDGRMWFTNRGTTAATQSIGQITTAGSVSAFIGGISASSGLGGIALGPDGNLWFTEQVGRIGRITPQGVVTEFSKGLTAGAVPVEIAAGPDGNLWFTEESSQASRIGRITPQGVITEFSKGITPGSDPATITAGPDGNLWFTEGLGNQIGVVCIVLGCRTRIILPHGLAIAVLSTTLDQAARVGILVEQVLGTKRLRIGRAPLGFHRNGRLRIDWNLRVNGRKLPQGRYLITLRALDDHNRVIAQALPATLVIH